MKTLRALLLASVVLAGIVVSTAPILAATHKPIQPTSGYVQDELPTPTPILVHPNNPCSGGGC